MNNATSTAPLRLVTSRRADDARELAVRCADFADLRNRPPWPEHDAIALYQRVGVRLTPTARLVYGVVRQAVRCGWAGAWVSYAELGEMVGCHARSAARAVDQLEAVKLVRRVPEYAPTQHAHLVTAGYTLAQLRNAYVLGPAAKEPRARRARGGGGPPKRGQNAGQIAYPMSQRDPEPIGSGVPPHVEHGKQPRSNAAQSLTSVLRRPKLVALAGGDVGAESAAPSARGQEHVGAVAPTQGGRAAAAQRAPEGGGRTADRRLTATVGEHLDFRRLCPRLTAAGFLDEPPAGEACTTPNSATTPPSGAPPSPPRSSS